MPRPPPRPLRLPDLVTNPQARAEYIQSHPPIHGVSSPYASSSRTSSAHYSNTPPSPSSTTDVNSHRASAATLASSGSPVTPASTHTSLSVHNSPWLSDFTKRASGSAGLMPTAGGIEEGKALGGTADNKARKSWSNAFASTKSWFGNAATAGPNDTSLMPEKKSAQKEIKLSPSMIAAYEATSMAPSPRPVSSPYPAAAEPPPLSPTGSAFSACQTPRVGSGLRYYTDRNPAPSQARVQIPDPIDPQGHDPPRLTSTQHQPSNGPTPTLTTFAKQLPADTQSQESAGLKDEDMSRGPPSPPPTPPKNVRDSDVPDIRVSSGDDL